MQPNTWLKLPRPTKMSAAEAIPEGMPGNYYVFDFLIELTIDGKTHIGRPCRAIRQININGKSPLVRWFSKTKFFLPDPTITRVPWIADPQKGFSGRMLRAPEDLLGAEGMIGDKKYFFEQILDLGNNVVVFGMYCEENQSRMAYGFSRDLFKA